MTISGREKTMAAITGVVLMYGVLGLVAKGRVEAWRLKREEYRQTIQRIERERGLIAQRGALEKRYAGVKDLMPVFPADKPVDTYWLGVMDKAASKNNLVISKRQVGAEKLVGDVYEIAIECKEWEGSLDSLVHFLYDLEVDGVMLDVRQLFMRPSPVDHSRLRGSFVLFCAYMRERPTAEAGSAVPTGGQRTSGNRGGPARK